MVGRDGVLERVAADESHGVVGPAVAVMAQAVDRDDAGVLQAADDLGLQQEAGPAEGVVGVVVEDLLQRHLSVQLAVHRHEDGAQAAPGVGPEDAEPLAVGGGRADGVVGRAVGVGIGIGVEVGQGSLDRGIAQAASDSRVERPAGMAARLFAASPPWASRWIAAIASTAGRCADLEVPQRDEVVGQRPGPVAGPGLEGGDEPGLVDQAVLQRDEAEEEVSVGGEGFHGARFLGGRTGGGRWTPDAGACRVGVIVSCRVCPCSPVEAARAPRTLDGPAPPPVAGGASDRVSAALARPRSTKRPRPPGRPSRPNLPNAGSS